MALGRLMTSTSGRRRGWDSSSSPGRRSQNHLGVGGGGGGECAERQNHMFFLNSKECSFPSARSSHFFHQNFGAVDMRAQALSGPLPWSNLKIQRHALPLITATAQPVFWPYWAGKRQVTALPLYHLSLSFPDVVYQPTNLFSTS